MKPSSQDIDRMTRALGWRPASFRAAAPARGATGTAARWIATERGDGRGRSAFVKIGGTALTADWIRREHLNYRTIGGWFIPDVVRALAWRGQIAAVRARGASVATAAAMTAA